jgi:hypothetical protein
METAEEDVEEEKVVPHLFAPVTRTYWSLDVIDAKSPIKAVG